MQPKFKTQMSKGKMKSGNLRLLIDSTKGKVSTVSLLDKEKVVDLVETENVLKSVDELLKKHGLVLKDLGKIEAVKGPGSYTGLKVSHSIANALNFALGRKELKFPEYDIK